jgi:hypothetical protein
MRLKISSILVATTIVFAQTANAQIARQLANVVALVKGSVAAADGSHPAGLPLVFLKGTERLTTTKTKPDGTFTMVVNPNAMYRIVVNDPHYMYHEDTVNVPQLSAYEEILVSVYVTPLNNGQRLDPQTPVFLPKATAIDAKGTAELEKIANEMKHNAKLSIAVNVYADKPVSKKDPSQQQIATARAANLRSFFLGKNIPSSRYDVNAVSDHVPEGKFDLGPGYASADEPVTKGKKKKQAAPVKTLVPQFVEITARLAQ